MICPQCCAAPPTPCQKAVSFWWDISLSEHHPCCAEEAGVCGGARNSSETGERTGLFSVRPAQEPDVHSGEFGMGSSNHWYRCNKKYVQLPARPVHWPISWGAHLKPTFRCLHLRFSMDRSVQRHTFSGNPCVLLSFLKLLPFYFNSLDEDLFLELCGFFLVGWRIYVSAVFVALQGKIRTLKK